MASEFVEIALIRAPSQDQQVSFGDLTNDVRQCLDDPVMRLVPCSPAAGNDPAGNGGRPGRRWRQCAAVTDHNDPLVAKAGMSRERDSLKAAYRDKRHGV